MRAELTALPPGNECCRRAEVTVLRHLTRNGEPDAYITRRLNALLSDLPGGPTVDRPSVGLPPGLITAQRCCITAVWRGALLATGTLVATKRQLNVAVTCPNPPTMMGLIGAARRIGIDEISAHQTTHQLLLASDGPTLLTTVGAHQTATAWHGQHK